MLRSFAAILIIFSSLVATAQLNNPSPYCTASYTNGCAERYISNVVTVGAATNISNSTNACGPFADGYNYYCNQFVGTNAGQTITFSISASGIVHQYGVRVYIDWSGDNIFTVPAEEFFSSGLMLISATFTFNVTVPAAQPNGKYRLRVRLEQWGTANNPCTTFLRGETEDYDIYVGIPTPGPSAPITATATGNGPLCSGQAINLNVNYTSTATPTFLWMGPSSFTSALQSPTITNIVAANNGNYVVSVYTGTCPVSANVLVTVYATPTISINSPTDCAGNSVTLTASGASTYTWSIGPNSSSIVVTPSVSTTYTVFSNNFNCASSQTVKATVLPEITISSLSPTICAGDQATINVTGATSYTWSTGSNFASILVSPSVTTVYSVTAVSGSCTATTFITQYVVVCTNLNLVDQSNNYLKIYPNPFKDELKISVEKPIMIKLTDIAGKEIFRKEISGETIINTSSLDKGMYLIHFSSEKGIKPIKVIKD